MNENEIDKVNEEEKAAQEKFIGDIKQHYRKMGEFEKDHGITDVLMAFTIYQTRFHYDTYLKFGMFGIDNPVPNPKYWNEDGYLREEYTMEPLGEFKITEVTIGEQESK